MTDWTKSHHPLYTPNNQTDYSTILYFLYLGRKLCMYFLQSQNCLLNQPVCSDQPNVISNSYSLIFAIIQIPAYTTKLYSRRTSSPTWSNVWQMWSRIALSIHWQFAHTQQTHWWRRPRLVVLAVTAELVVTAFALLVLRRTCLARAGDCHPPLMASRTRSNPLKTSW